MHDGITIEQVKASWEQIRRRIKGREHGAMIAALLMECEPVKIEHERTCPTVVIRSTVAFPVGVLRTSVNRGMVAWGISHVVGQTCQVRIEPPAASKRVPGEHDRLDLPASPAVFSVGMPWCFSELKHQWIDAIQSLARQPKDMLLATALAQCVLVRLQMDEVP